MKDEANFVERRETPRFGVMARLQDITYGVLRKHGVVREPDRDAISIKIIKD
jgi:hypothetical protein